MNSHVYNLSTPPYGLRGLDTGLSVSLSDRVVFVPQNAFGLLLHIHTHILQTTDAHSCWLHLGRLHTTTRHRTDEICTKAMSPHPTHEGLATERLAAQLSMAVRAKVLCVLGFVHAYAATHTHGTAPVKGGVEARGAPWFDRDDNVQKGMRQHPP